MNSHAYTEISLFLNLNSNIKSAQHTWSCRCFQLKSFQYSLPNQLEVFVTHTKIAHEMAHPVNSIWSCNTGYAKREECSEEEILEVCRITLKKSKINTSELLYFWLGWCGSQPDRLVGSVEHLGYVGKWLVTHVRSLPNYILLSQVTLISYLVSQK